MADHAPDHGRPSRGGLITGASRGIGRATALASAERGDRVAVDDASNREIRTPTIESDEHEETP